MSFCTFSVPESSIFSWSMSATRSSKCLETALNYFLCILVLFSQSGSKFSQVYCVGFQTLVSWYICCIMREWESFIWREKTASLASALVEMHSMANEDHWTMQVPRTYRPHCLGKWQGVAEDVNWHKGRTPTWHRASDIISKSCILSQRAVLRYHSSHWVGTVIWNFDYS